jgi:hypothetical protein
LLPAGGTYDYLWDGTGLRQTTMPAACWAMPDAYGPCGQIVDAPAGSYRVIATGYESCGGYGDCTCEPSGECFGEATGMEAYADPTTFVHPDESLVEVVFGVCAFPCPSS